MQFPDDPDAACQGRQARSLGSDVTASSGTAISTNFATSTCLENFVKNSFQFDVALKHAQDEVPARKSTPEKQKSPLATNRHRRRLKRRPQRIQNTVLCQSPGDIHYYSKETSVSDVRLSIPAVSCVATSASAGNPRSIFIK